MSADYKEKHLGDFEISFFKFEDLPSALKRFGSAEFLELNDKLKSERVNHLLYELISSVETPCFLLPAVLDYIQQINAAQVLDSYAFFHFELWLNQFSHLSDEENYLIRAKIAGKWIPRDEFQRLFPIGMGKVYPGSHYVTAHSSPDLDTIVASFWGWVDAFAARVAEGLHLWNVPGGAPHSVVEIELLFHRAFGKSVFTDLAKNRTSLALSGIDLMTQKGLIRKRASESTLMMDHMKAQNAIVLVDPQGYYLGDWRDVDVEGVRQVIVMLNHCLRWLENHLQTKLIALFGKEKLTLTDIPFFVDAVLSVKLIDTHPVQEFTERQKQHLEDYLVKVLNVGKGLSSSLAEFAGAMGQIALPSFQEFVALVEQMPASSLFGPNGALIEDRPKIFSYLEKIIRGFKSSDSECAQLR